MPERWKVARERAHHVCKPAVMPAAPKLAKVGQKFKGLRGAKTRVRRDNAPICRRNRICAPHKAKRFPKPREQVRFLSRTLTLGATSPVFASNARIVTPRLRSHATKGFVPRST
jgi:hypothetical protein